MEEQKDKLEEVKKEQGVVGSREKAEVAEKRPSRREFLNEGVKLSLAAAAALFATTGLLSSARAGDQIGDRNSCYSNTGTACYSNCYSALSSCYNNLAGCYNNCYRACHNDCYKDCFSCWSQACWSQCHGNRGWR